MDNRGAQPNDPTGQQESLDQPEVHIRDLRSQIGSRPVNLYAEEVVRAGLASIFAVFLPVRLSPRSSM